MDSSYRRWHGGLPVSMPDDQSDLMIPFLGLVASLGGDDVSQVLIEYMRYVQEKRRELGSLNA